MITPYACNFINQRLSDMTVGGNDGEREIGHHKTISKRQEGNKDKRNCARRPVAQAQSALLGAQNASGAVPCARNAIPAPKRNGPVRQSFGGPGMRTVIFARFLKCFGNLRRHVSLIVFGQNRIRHKQAVGTKAAFGDNALPFAEQVGQHALI